jgi:hypothetical protein
MLIKGAKYQLDKLKGYDRGSYFLGSDRHVSESDTGSEGSLVIGISVSADDIGGFGAICLDTQMHQ